MAADNCLFCRIASKEIPSDIVYEDERVVAFRDIQPQSPVHVLVIPRRHIPTLADMTADDVETVGHMHFVASRIADDLGISEEGYRAVINCRENGLQSVFHLHLHLLGGRKFGWPPG